MVIDYIGVKEISGSLIVLDGVENVSYEEIVDIRLDDGSRAYGKGGSAGGEKGCYPGV